MLSYHSKSTIGLSKYDAVEKNGIKQLVVDKAEDASKVFCSINMSSMQRHCRLT